MLLCFFACLRKKENTTVLAFAVLATTRHFSPSLLRLRLVDYSRVASPSTASLRSPPERRLPVMSGQPPGGGGGAGGGAGSASGQAAAAAAASSSSTSAAALEQLEQQLERSVENVRQIRIVVSDFQPQGQPGLNQARTRQGGLGIAEEEAPKMQ